MTQEHLTLLSAIEQFKPDNISNLEAALNIISNHAKKIRELTEEIERLERLLDHIGDAAKTRTGI